MVTAWSSFRAERAEEVATAALPFLDNITRERYIKETGKNPWAKKPGGGKLSPDQAGIVIETITPDLLASCLILGGYGVTVNIVHDRGNIPSPPFST